MRVNGRIGPVEELSEAELHSAVRAKVEGSWVLHELTRGQDVEMFVGYSSIASVWGSKGQGSYAAANRFVDMLAQHRRGRGEAGLSVNWGPWRGGGMASEEAQRQLRRLGVSAITVACRREAASATPRPLQTAPDRPPPIP